MTEVTSKSPEKVRYSNLAILLHWTMAALIIAQFLIAWYMEDLPLGPQAVEVYNLHKSIGITLLALAVLRLAWRFISPPPALPKELSTLEQKLAHLGHIGLYGAIFLMPLFGLIGSFASGFPTVFFGLFNITSPMTPNETLKEVLFELHEIFGILFLIMIVGHALAALKHSYLSKINILGRMLPGFGKSNR